MIACGASRPSGPTQALPLPPRAFGPRPRRLRSAGGFGDPSRVPISIDLRLASHRRFQLGVLALVLAGAGWSLARLAVRLPVAGLVAGEAVLALVLAFIAQGQQRSRGLRALLVLPALLACALAAACFLPWARLSPGAVLVVGPLFGLVTSLGLLPAHL